MPPSPFMDALRQHMLVHHYSKRSVESYAYWLRYYIRYHDRCHPAELGSSQVLELLGFLADHRQVSVATQKVALNALGFLYNKYLNIPLGNLGAFNKANRPRNLPVVLTRPEVGALFDELRGSTGYLCSRGRHRQGSNLSYAAPFVCDTPARSWSRYPHGPGAARTSGRKDERNLHACAEARRKGSP